MLKNFLHGSLLRGNRLPCLNFNQFFHKSVVNEQEEKKFKWEQSNDKIYPPQASDETPRPAYVCVVKKNIKYSMKKLWYVACFIRGMTVDEALKQLQFVNKKGAMIVRETVLEAQKKAVEEHNVEFKSNLWVSESSVGKGMTIKGYRRCARGRMVMMRYRYTHYFLTLEEGTPPKDYYYFTRNKSGDELLNEWLKKIRSRTVLNTL